MKTVLFELHFELSFFSITAVVFPKKIFCIECILPYALSLLHLSAISHLFGSDNSLQSTTVIIQILSVFEYTNTHTQV